jgi:hypothetical protein
MATAHDKSFVGTWRKASSDACAARYPAVLRFDANGIYAGEAETAGAFTWWDSGTWKLAQADELALSVANDAVERYPFKLDAQALTITDGQGCVVRYERGT